MGFHKVAPSSHDPTPSSLPWLQLWDTSYEHYAESCDKNQKDHSLSTAEEGFFSLVLRYCDVIAVRTWRGGDVSD